MWKTLRLTALVTCACVIATWAQSPASAPSTSAAFVPPKVIRRVLPLYPVPARRAEISGTVVTDVNIATSGDVSPSRASQSIPLLDQAALDALARWQFVPPRIEGQFAAGATTVAMNFRLVPAGHGFPPSHRTI